MEPKLFFSAPDPDPAPTFQIISDPDPAPDPDPDPVPDPAKFFIKEKTEKLTVPNQLVLVQISSHFSH